MGKIKSIFSNVAAWVKSHVKIIMIAVVIVIIAIVVLNVIGSSEKRAVKKYLVAVNSCDDAKIVKSMDIEAAIAWDNSGYSDEDIIKNFKDKLDAVDKDNVEDFKKDMKKKYSKDDKGKIKYDLKNVVYAVKAKDNKDLTKVVCKVAVTSKPSEDDKDELEDSVWKNEKAYNAKAETYMTFYLYKGKVVSSPMISYGSLLDY